MKTKSWLIASLFIFGIISAPAQNLFEKLSDDKHVTVVYVSKAMLNMFPSVTTQANVNGVDIHNIVNKLEQIEIYTSEQKEGMQSIRSEAKKLQSSNKTYEVLMRVKDEGQNVIFYGEKEKDLFKSLIMFVDSETECVLIRILGSFTAEDIQEITKAKK